MRSLLPLQAYSQKQLSDVSVRVDELTRFISAPIQVELDRLDRKAKDHGNKVREAYASRQRYRNLSTLLRDRELEVQSVTEQADALRSSLSGLSDEEREIVSQGKVYSAAYSTVDGWRSGAATIREKASELAQIAESQTGNAKSAPTEPEGQREILEQAHSEYTSLLAKVAGHLSELAEAAEKIAETQQEKLVGVWKKWDDDYRSFQVRYSAAMKQSSSHVEKLAQLRILEKILSELDRETNNVKETLTTLSVAEDRYRQARTAWLLVHRERDELIDIECSALTKRSGGLISVKVRRFAEPKSFVELLRQFLSGSRVQSAKLEGIGEGISNAPDPEASFVAVLDEFELLANYDAANALSGVRPATPALVMLGLNSGDLDRIAEKLTPENWLILSLTPIDSTPVYEFQSRDGVSISFKNASAGQQATALLKTLLNQSGPPLIIDQPEEDLDNPVILEIVSQLWEAKKFRQVIFASHNANLVVNGDAELVAWFGYRQSGDQSRGTIQGVGAIDVDEARAAIKTIMEGGENAFRLRREKYGF